MRIAAVAAVLAGVAAWPAASPSATHGACGLVTRAEARAALGRRVAEPRGGVVVRYHHTVRSCSYSTTFRIDDPASNRRSASVRTLLLGLPEFLLTERAEPTPVRRVRGLGVPAFAVGVRPTLFAWKRGTELMLQVDGVTDAVAREKQLARAALARL